MKRWIVTAALIGVVLSAGVLAWNATPPATAQDDGTGIETVISAQVTKYLGSDDALWTVGDACTITVTETAQAGLTVLNFATRLAVTDQTGEIVATTTMEGEVFANDAGTFRCVAQLSISVPDRPFYSLTLGDTTLATFSQDDLPFTDDTNPDILVPSDVLG